MAACPVVGNLIQNGQEVLDELARANVSVAAVWWTKVIAEATWTGERPDPLGSSVVQTCLRAASTR